MCIDRESFKMSNLEYLKVTIQVKFLIRLVTSANEIDAMIVAVFNDANESTYCGHHLCWVCVWVCIH